MRERLSFVIFIYLFILIFYFILLGSLVRANLELYKWACGMIAFDQELQSCFLFHRLSGTPSSSIHFNEVRPILVIMNLIY